MLRDLLKSDQLRKRSNTDANLNTVLFFFEALIQEFN